MVTVISLQVKDSVRWQKLYDKQIDMWQR